jgi:hypothetical protein
VPGYDITFKENNICRQKKWGLFRYSEECLLRTSQEEKDWRSELSNDENKYKKLGNTNTLFRNS